MITYWTNFEKLKLDIGSSVGMIYLPRIQSKLLPHEIVITSLAEDSQGEDIDLEYRCWENEINQVGKRVLNRTQNDRCLARIVLGDSGLVALIEGKLNSGRQIQGNEGSLRYREIYREE